MHWGRRRRFIGNSKQSFLSDENLAILFVVFCEKSDFINKVSLWSQCAFNSMGRGGGSEQRGGGSSIFEPMEGVSHVIFDYA